MAQKKTIKNKSKQWLPSIQKEIQGILYLGFACILFLSLASFTEGYDRRNWLGLFGYFMAHTMLWLFGIGSYAICVFIAWIGWRSVFRKSINKILKKSLLLLGITLSFGVYVTVLTDTFPSFAERAISHCVHYDYIATIDGYPGAVRYYTGGVPAYYLYRDLPDFNLYRILNHIGTALISLLAFIACAASLIKVPLIAPLFKLAHQFEAWANQQKDSIAKYFKREKKEDQVSKVEFPFSNPIEKKVSIYQLPPSPIKEEEKTETPEEVISEKTTPQVMVPKESSSSNFLDYNCPGLELLSVAKGVDPSSLQKTLQEQARVLEETLESFGINAKVGQIHCGPTITSFEVHPPVGIKVQKIKALSNDIALNMRAKSIRILAPIPGKAAVGVEVPNPRPQEVSFREILKTYQEGEKRSCIPLLLGQTVHGDFVINDLTKMPHCIIAGATGSGKSVCINTIIMSILMNTKPDEVKLLMIDPKKVELTPYTLLPHMVAPVITEPHEAYAALCWLVREMEYRYEVLKNLGVRNIASFNERSRDQTAEEEMPIEIPEKMFYIVGIVDELADLMMVANNDIETPIARIAQMARAVGIHLILATQRPSREVITGLIKANFPTRIAFKVASRINSQIILDEGGAESLLGNGDLLFLPPGSHHLIRAQGPFIRDKDINQVVEAICAQSPPNYLIPSFATGAETSIESINGPENLNADSLYQEAFDLVCKTGNASTTFLQRKLKVGYARAASIMDQLEEQGIVGSLEGSKGRKVLVDILENEE